MSAVAHVEKRGKKKYRARYRGPDGKELSRTFERKVDAEQFLNATEVAKTRGEWVEPSVRKTTVGDLGAQLLATKGDRNTAAWNRAMLLHVNRTWQHTPIPA